MNLDLRGSIIGLGLLATAALQLPAGAADSTPRGFLTSIYGGEGKPGAPVDIPCNPVDRAGIERQFEPAAAKLVSWALKYADGCVFTGLDGSEEWVADSIDIVTTATDRKRAVGTVIMMVHGKAATSSQKSTIVLDLVRSGPHWRIADIDYGENKLSQMRGR